MKLDLEVMKTQANRDGLRPEQALALIDELAETRRRATEELKALLHERDEARAALSAARAAAFEGAAHLADNRRSVCCTGEKACPDGDPRCDVPREIAAEIRALALRPPPFVCVPVETLEKSKEALRTVYEWASEAMIPYDLWRHFLHTDADGVVMIRAAIAALTKVTP